MPAQAVQEGLGLHVWQYAKRSKRVERTPTETEIRATQPPGYRKKKEPPAHFPPHVTEGPKNFYLEVPGLLPTITSSLTGGIPRPEIEMVDQDFPRCQ